jgi:hypothetical protein
MSTKSSQIDKLQSELVSSAAPLRELIKRAKSTGKAFAATDQIGGSLQGPVSDPPNPRANQPFNFFDAFQVHIPIGSQPGTYAIQCGIALISAAGTNLSQAFLYWPVEPQSGDFGPEAIGQYLPGQSAGQYTIASALTLIPPGGQPLQLDGKSATLTIAP